MSLTMQEAKALLNTINTESTEVAEAELRAIISQLDVDAPGSITLLYSNTLDNGVWTGDVVTALLPTFGKDVRTIDKTQSAEFLDLTKNSELVTTLDKIFPGSDPNKYGSVANQFLYGTVDADGKRIAADGAWDIASKKFAQEAVGDVITLTPNAKENGVFAMTELGAMLNTPEISSINGIPREDLVDAKNVLIDGGMIDNGRDLFTDIQPVFTLTAFAA